MAVKYNRTGYADSEHRRQNRWENPRRDPQSLKRRIFQINAGILLFTAALMIYALTGAKRDNRWLPERVGQGTVVAIVEEVSTPVARYRIEIEVDVPKAEPREAALLPASVEDRDARLGPLQLRHAALLDERARELFAPGARVEVMYQIDVKRTKIYIRDVRPVE
jgi:hypothetical protein